MSADSKVTKPLDHMRRSRLFALVQERKESSIASAIGISRSTLGRAIAGLDLYPGTRHMIETRMAEIAEAERAERALVSS